MKKILLIQSILLFFFSCISMQNEPTDNLSPFVLPFDDGSSGITNMGERLNHRPAGSLGPLKTDELGHFVLDGQRTRFWGVNITDSSCFPSHEDAENIARRLGKFGVNIVRFHHMEQTWASRSLIDYTQQGSRHLNEENLDRLFYFIHQLKQQGIYSNINLMTAREFKQADELSPELARLDIKSRHILGFLLPEIRDLEKEHARNILTPVNPYTGISLAEDPAVAFVEINNENGLIMRYVDDDMDNWPQSLQEILQQKWNSWLSEKYRSHDEMLQHWGVVDVPLDEEILVNTDFKDGVQPWNLEAHQGAQAEVNIIQSGEVEILVKETGQAGWNVQFNQRGVKVTQGQIYTLTFSARSETHESFSAGLHMAYDPWYSIDSSVFTVEPQWQDYTLTIEAPSDDKHLRIIFSDLALTQGKVDIRNISFRSGGKIGQLPADESLSLENLSINRHSLRYTLGRNEDWMAFLRDLERDYWTDMRLFLQDDLQLQGLPGGTIASLSPPSVQEDFGYLDGHSYWRHPNFPGRPWDINNWTVQGDSMVNTLNNTLEGLAYQRVMGRPFTLSEYQHSMPNPFMQEGPWMAAAYGALQDWDAIYFFAYNAGAEERWDTGYFDSFFQSNKHPGFMVNMAAAANIFRRGDVAAAREIVELDFSDSVELKIMAQQSVPWHIATGKHLDPPLGLSLIHRVALNTQNNQNLSENGLNEALSGDQSPGSQDKPWGYFPEDQRVFTSDTGELSWNMENPQAGFITLNSPRSKGVMGFVQRLEYNLGSLSVRFGELQMDWATLLITAQQGSLDLLEEPVSILITATGRVENTQMGWTDESHSSLGSNWGKAPTRIETIPLELSLPVEAERVQAWVLDQLGQRGIPLIIVSTERGCKIVVQGNEGSVWFEVEVE
ncbi:MAG: carbohydrate binding domain-containing protein [Spirochaetaceae bacterium]|jgi:hypothetical protein|nr:carbohydrate binding domain-containing protein [Spirochaetaceae bacterium]